jgi:hypothetical protein
MAKKLTEKQVHAMAVQAAHGVSNYGHGEVVTPKPDHRNMRTIYVQDMDSYKAAQAKAAEMKISMSEFIARAITAYMNPENCPVCSRMSEIMRTAGSLDKRKGKK